MRSLFVGFALSAGIVACSDRTPAPPTPSAPSVPAAAPGPRAPGPPLTQRDIAPSAPVDLSRAIPPEALRPPAAGSVPDGTAPLRPEGGLVVARGWRRPSITVGTSGMIVSFGRGTEHTAPPVGAASECEWMETLVALPWEALDGGEPIPLRERPCNPRKPSLRVVLGDTAWEPVAIACEADRGLRCDVHALGPRTYPSFRVDGRRALPTFVELVGVPYEEVSAAMLFGRSIVWVNVAAGGRAPAVSTIGPPLPFACTFETCGLGIWPGREGTSVEISHTDRREHTVFVDGVRRGEATLERMEGGDPLRRGPYAIDSTHRLVYRYTLSTRDLDVPVGGVTGPAVDFGRATGAAGPLLAWIEGDASSGRLRIAQLNMIGTDVFGTPSELASGAFDAVAIASLSGHTAIAWSERAGDSWQVRVAEVRLFSDR